VKNFSVQVCEDGMITDFHRRPQVVPTDSNPTKSVMAAAYANFLRLFQSELVTVMVPPHTPHRRRPVRMYLDSMPFVAGGRAQELIAFALYVAALVFVAGHRRALIAAMSGAVYRRWGLLTEP
jgi:hypothetical protein